MESRSRSDSNVPIRIFISSPSDVSDERRRAALVINKLSREFSRAFDISPVLWEYEPMLAAGTFQDVITPPSSTDIVIVVLWSRLGTALPPPYVSPLDGRAPVTGTEWEFEDAMKHRAEHGTPDVLVYRNSAESLLRYRTDDELDDVKRQRSALKAFWERYFVSGDGFLTLANADYSSLDGFAERLERDLRELLLRRLDDLSKRGRGINWYGGSPYRGLYAFDIEHAPIFFGRSLAQREVTEALLRCASKPGEPAFCMILGASGSGKSSLARAGVMVDLMAPGVADGIDAWRYCTFRPHQGSGNIVAGLADALFANANALPELAEIRFSADDTARLFANADASSVLPIRNVLIHIGEKLAGPQGRSAARVALVLLIDQFEELFTDTATTDAQRDTFVRLLAALARGGVYVLATMRSEYYPRLASLPQLRELVAGDGQYLLTAPSAAELDDMIRLPAAAARVSFERDAEGIGLDARLRDDAVRDPLCLPLLEFALDQMYRIDIEQAQGRILTFKTYGDIGRLQGAIASHAEAILGALPEAVSAWFPEVLQQLVTIDLDTGAVTSRQASYQDVMADGTDGATERAALLDALTGEQARLLVSDRGGDDRVVRLAHEALIAPGNWSRVDAIIDDYRDFLRDRERAELAMTLWEASGRSPDNLLLGARALAGARELLEQRISPALRGFLAQSIAAAEARDRERHDAERRVATRRFRIAAAVAAVLALLAGGAVYEWQAARIAVAAETTALQKAEQSAKAATAAQHEAQASAAAEKAAADEARRRRDFASRTQSFYLARLSDQQRAKGSTQTAAAIALEILPNDLSTSSQTLAEALTSLTRDIGSDRQRVGIVPGGSGMVLARMSPAGDRIVSYGTDHTATLWDAASGRAIRTYPQYAPDGHASPIFAHDGSWFLVVLNNGVIEVHRSDGSNTIIARFDGHRKRPSGVAISGDDKWVASSEMESANQSHIRIWKAATGEPRYVFDTDMGFTKTFLLNHDGSRMLISGPGGKLLLYDVDKRAWKGAIKGPIGESAFAFSPDGSAFAVGDQAGDLWLMDEDGAVLHRTTHAHGKAVTALQFTADGTMLVTGSSDRTVKTWTSVLDGPKNTYFDHQFEVTAVAASADGGVIASADKETVYVRDRDGHADALAFSRSPVEVASIALSPDGGRLFLETSGQSFSVFDVQPPPPLLALDHDGAELGRVTQSADGSRIAVASRSDGRVWLWNAGTGHLIKTWQAHQLPLTGLQFLPDGQRLLSGSRDGTAAMWDANTGEQIFPLPRQEGQVYFASSPDGAARFLTYVQENVVWSHKSAGWRAPIKIWDAQTGKLLQTLDATTAEIYDAIFVADGKQVLSTDKSGDIILSNVSDGSVARRLKLSRPNAPEDHPTAVELHLLADKKSVVGMGYETLVRLDLDHETPQYLSTIQAGIFERSKIDERHQLAIAPFASRVVAWRLGDGSVAWSRQLPEQEGRATTAAVLDAKSTTVAVGTDQGYVVLLDAETGQEVWSQQVHSGPVSAADFRGQRAVLTAGFDGRLLAMPTPLRDQDAIDYSRATETEELHDWERTLFGIIKWEDTPSASSPAPSASDAEARCDATARPLSEPAGKAPAVAFRDIDVAKAEAACRDALTKTPGAPRALMELGRVLSKAGRDAEAVALFQQASAAGSVAATTYLAIALQNGDGVAKNEATALAQLLHAAEAGDTLAMYQLGRTYRNGRGVTADSDVARTWWEKAAGLGFPFAMHELAALLSDPAYARHDGGMALYWYARESELYDKLPGFGADTQMAFQSRGNAARQLPVDVVLREYRRARQDSVAQR